MKSQYDVIIIGSGIGGLTTGSYLSRNGYKVRIFEKLHQPGGYVNTFKRKDYTFEGSTHILHEFEDFNFNFDVLKRLGLENLELLHINDCFDIFIHDHNKIIKNYKIDSGKEDGFKCFVNQFSSDIKNIKIIFEKCYHIAKDCFKIVKLESSPYKINFIDLISALFLLIKDKNSLLRKIGEFHYKYLNEYINKSFSDLTRFIDNQDLKFLLDILGYMCTNVKPSKLSAITGAAIFYQFVLRKPTWVKGGTKSMVEALANNIINNNGEIIYKSQVTQIIIEKGKSIGVILANGEKYYAKYIVSNLNGYETYKNLIDCDTHTEELTTKLSNYKSSLSAFIVYLGLPFDLQDFGFDRSTNVFSNCNNLDTVKQEIYKSEDSYREDTFIITNYTLMDESFSKKGKSSIALATAETFENWNKLTKKEYNKQKILIQSQFIQNVQKITRIPLDKAEVSFSATPKTLKFYSSNPFGGVIGADHNVEQTGLGRFNHKTHIKNLFHAGHDTKTGGGINAVINSGLIAASHILRKG
ncbi:MAG: hypothetical protein A2Y34_00625 [Spirochaetes bacterium GWC1_27_15]|nr:MAG: hypothetical protein A2Z98_14540 [Spirochaetes bacterium GWB1_27_13]OHD21910.1 MAG: hypothetical protein A2Y34_00625 [Spirochaetes bacterium GWC1_27_15]